MSKLDYIRFLVLVFASLCGWSAVTASEAVAIKRLTTTILADNVDACATFWTERLGFQQTLAVPNQLPGGAGHQFIAVASDHHELMFQSIASAEGELPGMFALAGQSSFLLYVEVSDLDAAIEQMAGLEPAISRRTTFYGSEEIGYHDSCGTLVVLAEFPVASEDQDPDAPNEP